MEKLIEEVKTLVEAEYGRASAKFGAVNHSDHESYAILLEECQEAESECMAVHDILGYFWNQTKRNDPDQEKFKICQKLQTSAILAACELIQVAAMARKAALTISHRTVVTDLTQKGGESV